MSSQILTDLLGNTVATQFAGNADPTLGTEADEEGKNHLL